MAGLPSIVWGGESRRVVLAVHGAYGNKRDALMAMVASVAVALGHQVVSVDLPGHGDRTDGDRLVPWAFVPELRAVHDCLSAEGSRQVSLVACSLGAYFSLQALATRPLRRALLLSPLVDMAAYIRRQLKVRSLTEEHLRLAGTIPVPYGQPLTWRYFRYACEHPVDWPHRTRVLWGRHDDVVPREDIERFAAHSGAPVTVLDTGHSFGPEQDPVVRGWLEEGLV